MINLHIGCGNNILNGWINIDIAGNPEVKIDIRNGLPYSSNTVDFIYNEHFIEHLTYEEAFNFLKESYRCLKEGGVIRIATPGLDALIKSYNSKNWRDQDWLKSSSYNWVKTKGQMFNLSFRGWGHKYIYNEEDLTIQLKNAGFKNINRCEIAKSEYVYLQNLETRKESTLILEAEKT